jgi:hypothetical protein
VVVQSAGWIAVAALGSAALTGLASLGVVGFQEWRRNKTSGRLAREAAIITILARSLDVAQRARVLGDTMKLRSGLGEGIAVTGLFRRPFDPMAMFDWLAQDSRPLNEALVAIWTSADKETVRLANKVVFHCADLLSASTARQPTATAGEQSRRFVIGERWTDEMLADYETAIQTLARARKHLAEHTRKALGRDAVDLFA